MTIPRKRSVIQICLVLLCGTLVASLAAQQPASKKTVAEVLEDDGASLLKSLTQGDTSGARVESSDVYSGKTSIMITPMQRFDPRIPGWQYKIAKNPGPGEYRFLRFAWKCDGCTGVMIQFHDQRDWFIRYTAGNNPPQWDTKFVAAKPPSKWVVVTQDVYGDYGERTITGLALTAFGGRAAYFDHIYLGRSIEDLDRIDATGVRNGKSRELAGDELDRLWRSLAGDDAPAAYLAFWQLAAVPKQSVPFLNGKLAVPQAKFDVAKIRQWIRQLDSDQFRTRDAASKQLAQQLEASVALLEETLRGSPSEETRRRITLLLALRITSDSARERIEKAVRVLEYLETPEAKKCLDELAKGSDGIQPIEAAKAALKRLMARR